MLPTASHSIQIEISWVYSTQDPAALLEWGQHTDEDVNR